MTADSLSSPADDEEFQAVGMFPGDGNIDGGVCGEDDIVDVRVADDIAAIVETIATADFPAEMPSRQEALSRSVSMGMAFMEITPIQLKEIHK